MHHCAADNFKPFPWCQPSHCHHIFFLDFYFYFSFHFWLRQSFHCSSFAWPYKNRITNCSQKQLQLQLPRMGTFSDIFMSSCKRFLAFVRFFLCTSFPQTCFPLAKFVVREKFSQDEDRTSTCDWWWAWFSGFQMSAADSPLFLLLIDKHFAVAWNVNAGNSIERLPWEIQLPFWPTQQLSLIYSQAKLFHLHIATYISLEWARTFN